MAKPMMKAKAKAAMKKKMPPNKMNGPTEGSAAAEAADTPAAIGKGAAAARAKRLAGYQL
jgi:hypothetical protein